MKREIKFRAWDIATQTMYYSDENQTVWCGGKTCSVKGINGQIPGNYIPMQYTGLKDKNGVEIYEGDIINDPEWWWGPGEVFLNVGECGPCKGDSVMSYICRGKEGHVSHNIWNGEWVEVIGNIYENPELI